MSVDQDGPPVCTVIGGANGSGKSSLYELLKLPGQLINADVIAKAIDPGEPERASFLAGRRTLEALGRLLRARSSFVYETTLSSRQSVDLMATAQRKGYQVGLVFVVLRRVELNVSRVAERVARGGHRIAEDAIRRRYETAFARLPVAIGIADQSMVIDNSSTAGPRVLARVEGHAMVEDHLAEDDPFHRRIAEAVRKGLLASRSR